MRALVVVAHPDDETLFFGGLIASNPTYNWEVACVTDGGERAKERAWELEQACARLGVDRVHHLKFTDDPSQRLPIGAVSAALRELGEFDEIYTHGPLGDYGHPHHQDVCLAVHQSFPGHSKLWSLARSIYPEKTVQLSAEVYALKAELMATVYQKEHQSFLLVLPVNYYEGFSRVSLVEVEALHQLLSRRVEPQSDSVKHYSTLLPMIRAGAVESSFAAFLAAYSGAATVSS